jgi:hypothetical protein
MTPFTMRSLTVRNRIVSTSHEPAYSEDGLPKDRYRAYHVEKAKGGVGLTMIGGSAVVSRGSTPAFGNLQLWKDESVPWLRRLADEVHDHGAAVMIQLTHMGHRTSSTTHDWLPAVSASGVREPAHRTFAKPAEAWTWSRSRPTSCWRRGAASRPAWTGWNSCSTGTSSMRSSLHPGSRRRSQRPRGHARRRSTVPGDLTGGRRRGCCDV